MNWVKKGLIYVANGQYAWARTHAMLPTPDWISTDTLRLYLTFCDEEGVGRVGYVDVDSYNPSNILCVSKKPVLDIGQPGTFDENGVLQTSIVTLPNGRKYLYYVGFELGTKIRYRLLTGIAVSDDAGETFQRIQKTPILERSDEELYFRCGSFVLLEEGLFKLWYVAGSAWLDINGKPMPIYSINYLQSQDGIHWGKKGKPCITIEHEDEHGFGRPYVYKENNIYKMFYSIRHKTLGYRLGYAESKDGMNWLRKDEQVNLNVSEAGWDDQMLCYAAIMRMHGKTYLFYNGNEFGKTGFGFAALEEAYAY